MDPKNTTLQSPGFIQSSQPQYTTQINQAHPNSYSNSPYTSGVHNQWQVTSVHHLGSHLELGSATKQPSTPVIQREMTVQPSTESHLTPQKPSDLHAFLENKANEPPVIWINKKEGILEINNWRLLEAEWKKAQVHKGISPPRDLHNDLCYSEDITGLSGQQYGLKFKTKLVTKMTSNKTSRPQHTPYHRPEQSKEPQLSTYSSTRNFCATRPTQNVISSPAQQLYGCSFLKKQAEIGASVIWADKNQGIIKVINLYQLNSQWNSLQQQHGLLNGETLQDALKKESVKGDIEYLGSTPDNESIFQLKYKNYSASITPLENIKLTTALPTTEPVTSHANVPQGSTSGTATTRAEALDDVLDILKILGELPKSPTESPQIPLSVQSSSTAYPITSAFKVPKSCEGCLFFILSNADSHRGFAKWHNKSNGELTIDINELTHHWLSLHPPGYSHQTGFDFVARFFAAQNYWTYDTDRNIYCLNGQHPVTRQAIEMADMQRLRHSSPPQLSDLPNPSVQNMPQFTSEAGNQPLIFPSQSLSKPPKNSMLEWIMQDIAGSQKFTQWHGVLRSELKLDLNALQNYWSTNLQFFGLEKIDPHTAYNSINQLVNLGLCQYNHQTGILTLNDKNPPQAEMAFNQQRHSGN